MGLRCLKQKLSRLQVPKTKPEDKNPFSPGAALATALLLPWPI